MLWEISQHDAMSRTPHPVIEAAVCVALLVGMFVGFVALFYWASAPYAGGW